MRELSLDNCRLDKRYDIFALLGRGSYAEIFAAHDTLASHRSPHRQVAIKALNVFLQDDLDPELERTLVENFQNEAVALDRVRHPNIISRLGHGTARDAKGTLFHYIVLEYLEGGDLHKACRERPLGLKRALTYIEQVCAGLGHAHASGVIHRDIKPQNLLLTKDAEIVKIADFGVARIHAANTPITRVGTNIYAPPEHSPLGVDGDVMTVASLTPAADIYSLAKSIYTLVTCESPRIYAGQSIVDLPEACREEDWAGELKRVLARATQRDPEDRHQSVEEFWQDLEGVRRYVDDLQSATLVRPKFHAVPQPAIAQGYSPVAPVSARFDTSRELKLRHRFGPAAAVPAVDLKAVALPKHPAVTMPDKRTMPEELAESPRLQINIPNAVDPNSLPSPAGGRGRLTRAAAVILGLALFAAGLFLTNSFLKDSGFWPDILAQRDTSTGVANRDINLRPSPNTDNDPIGLVTKNSRVRIVKTENNWYQVDVIEQGRPREPGIAASSGWLYGRYIDIDQN